MTKYFLTIALVLVFAFPPLAVADDSEPPTGTVALLCKTAHFSQVTTKTLSIDYDKKQVNENPATFTPSMIAWTVGNGSEGEHHELNRITGTYYYWIDGETSGKPMPTYHCEKAPAKF